GGWRVASKRVLYQLVWKYPVDKTPSTDYFTVQYETNESPRRPWAPSRLRSRRHPPAGARALLAPGLRGDLAFRSHRCHGHQSSQPLRRFWQQGAALSQGLGTLSLRS